MHIIFQGLKVNQYGRSLDCGEDVCACVRVCVCVCLWGGNGTNELKGWSGAKLSETLSKKFDFTLRNTESLKCLSR